MDMSLGQILKTAGIDTVLGMGTVFAVLIIISLCIWGLGIAIKQEDPAAAAADSVPAADVKPVAHSDADGELVAVITAAISQFIRNQYGEEVDEGQYIVRNIRRASWKHIS